MAGLRRLFSDIGPVYEAERALDPRWKLPDRPVEADPRSRLADPYNPDREPTVLAQDSLKPLIDDETTDGKWTVKQQQVCFVYGDDDDDDEECFKLEVAGNIATFIDSDGKGRRYTILKGNPKNL